MTKLDWQAIARRTGWPDAREFVEQSLLPLLEDIPAEARGKNGKIKPPLELPFGVAMFLFGVAFFSAFLFLPGGFFGGLLQFILFPILFFACFGLTLFACRGRFFAFLERVEARYLARSSALTPIAERAGLSYVPSPGGSPAALKWIARQSWAPEVARRMSRMLDDNGGMDEAVAVAGQSGLLLTSSTHLGGVEARQRYNAQRLENLQCEDGFEGQVDGIHLRAFEWVEKGDDAPDTWHLIMVFDLPLNLSGVTHLRSRKTSWPSYLGQRRLQNIPLGHAGFSERFRLRTDDAVEAHLIFDPAVIERVAKMAADEKVRAVAFGNHLVVAFEGEDRFAMVDLETGEWSVERIAKTLINIVEIKDLTKSIANAFYLAARQGRVAS